MKKTTIMRSLLLIVVSTSLLLTSCEKDKNPIANQEDAIKLTIASGASQSLYDDVFDVILQDGENNNVAGRGENVERVASCATVTVSPMDPGVFPKTMTIDFGAGCTSPNGITRKGKLIATLSGPIRTSGTSIAVTFDNYFVNNYKLEGAYTITNNGGTGLNFTTQLTNGKLTYPDGTTWYTHSGTHTLNQTAGAGTLTFADDVYAVSGNGTTMSSAGNTLTVNITSPLVKKGDCRNISSGVETFTYNNLSGTLNFGDGTCDNLATLTVGIFSQVIILPR